MIRRRIISAALSAAMAMSAFAGLTCVTAGAEDVVYKQTPRMMEELNRGLIAVKTSAGVYLSWRVLGKEDLATTAYDIYREGTTDKIATIAGGQASNYIDKTGTSANKYKVVVSTATQDQIAEEPWTQAQDTKGDNTTYTYFDVPISLPTDIPHANTSAMSDYSRANGGSANDASVGDLDGDGDYEIVLKWDPMDSKDSNKSNTTGHCVFDAYEIDSKNGGYMWRIDIGNNIAAGAHYSQFIVYDFDGDGKSEMATLTAPGSYSLVKNAEGGYDKIYVTTVGDTEEIQKADNNATTLRKGNNAGPEYYTIFDGETGRPLRTTDAIPLGRIDGGDYGDTSMNRSSRYLAGVAYLDGIHPSLIECRGYYDKAMLRAYNWDGESLEMLWEHDGSADKASTMYGQGNHNLSISDIDNDGKDEIVWGSACLDDDGQTVLGNTRHKHGDALHVSDFNNDSWQEAFSVKEKSAGFANGIQLRNPVTGAMIWSKSVKSDNGRGVMDNIDDAYALAHPDALALGWDAAHDKTYDLKGNEVAAKPNGNSRNFCNFLVYWDDDLGRELLDGNQMAKYHAATGVTDRIFFNGQGYLTGASANNSTKQTPSLVADLWGDWREEIIMPADNDTVLRIFTPISQTKYRLTTLMHDSQYRTAIAWQNVGYNQPPHTSYYIGSAALAKDASGTTLNYLAPATPFDTIMYPSDIPDTPITDIELKHDGHNVDTNQTITLERTQTYQIDASVLPSEARKKGIRWTSSDPTLATVDGGIIKAVGRGAESASGEGGDVTITATAAGNDAVTKSVKVKVWSTPVTSVKITDPSETVKSLTPGDSITMTATVEPANASEKTVEWRSSNPTVATVDAEGKVTAVSMGLATIYAKTVDGGYEDAKVINVLPPAMENAAGNEGFILDTEGCGTYSGSNTGARLTQENNANEATVHKTVETVDSDKAKLSFHYVTGGTKIDGSNWNWKNHEFSMYVKLLGSNGENILTFHQPWTKVSGDTVGAADLTTQANGESSAQAFPNGWNTVEEGKGNISGSAKTWDVEIEFNYAENTANAYICGYNNGSIQGQYTKSFTLQDGVKLSKVEFSSKKENGCQGIYWTPQVSNFSYEKIVPAATGSASVLYRRGEKKGISWSANDIAATTGGFTATGETLMFDEENHRIWFNPTKPGASYSATKTFDIADNALVEYDIDWYFGSAVGNDREHSEYIQIGDQIRFGWKNDYKVYLSKDGGTTWEANPVFTGSNTTFTKNIHLTYDKDTNTVKSLTFDGSTVMANETFDDPMDKVTFGLNRIEGSSTENWGYPNGIDNISVSQFVPNAVTKFKASFVNIDGTIIDEQDVEVGQYATKPDQDPTKDGDDKYGTYEFTKWDPDPATTIIMDDTVFTAQYNTGSPVHYTVTLNRNGGEFANPEDDVTGYDYGTAVTLPTGLTKTGHTFAGWYEDEQCEGDEVSEIGSDEVGNKQYYAKWTPETYAVTLNLVGGTLAEGENITSYTYGAAVKLPTPTKKGSSFVGWYADENYTEPAVTEIPANSTGEKTYYAKWEVGKYKITYHLLGGSLPEGTPEEYAYGTAVTLPANPTKAGFTFGGWYTTATYRSKAGNITATDEGNKTYYAKWKSAAPAIEYAETAEDGKTVTAYVAASAKTNKIIGALYDGNKLVEAKSVDASTATTFEANVLYSNSSLVFTHNVSDYTLKLFLWDSVGGAKPLAAASVHNKE